MLPGNSKTRLHRRPDRRDTSLHSSVLLQAKKGSRNKDLQRRTGKGFRVERAKVTSQDRW